MLRTWPNTCQHGCLHSGDFYSFSLAGFPEDRWLKRKTHIVFALQAMDHSNTDIWKAKPIKKKLFQSTCWQIFQSQSLRCCKLNKGLNLFICHSWGCFKTQLRVWESVLFSLHQDSVKSRKCETRKQDCCIQPPLPLSCPPLLLFVVLLLTKTGQPSGIFEQTRLGFLLFSLLARLLCTVPAGHNCPPPTSPLLVSFYICNVISWLGTLAYVVQSPIQ